MTTIYYSLLLVVKIGRVKTPEFTSNNIPSLCKLHVLSVLREEQKEKKSKNRVKELFNYAGRKPVPWATLYDYKTTFLHFVRALQVSKFCISLSRLYCQSDLFETENLARILIVGIEWGAFVLHGLGHVGCSKTIFLARISVPYITLNKCQAASPVLQSSLVGEWLPHWLSL